MTQQPTETDTFRDDLTDLIPYMRAFARSLCGDTTAGEDLAQEALLKAWTARASYQPGTNLKAWVFTIIRHQFYSEKRRSWRSVQLDVDHAERTLVAVTNPTGAIELDELRRALMRLPEEQREALILIGAGGLSYEEVAEMSGVAVGTVKSRVSRARDRIALIFAEGSFAKDGAPADQAMASILAQLHDAGRSLRLAA